MSDVHVLGCRRVSAGPKYVRERFFTASAHAEYFKREPDLRPYFQEQVVQFQTYVKLRKAILGQLKHLAGSPANEHGPGTSPLISVKSSAESKRSASPGDITKGLTS